MNSTIKKSTMLPVETLEKLAGKLFYQRKRFKKKLFDGKSNVEKKM